MTADAVVFWLDDGAARETAAHALEAWAKAHGVVLGTPAPPIAGLAIDPGVGDRIEAELEKAREAIAATDAEAVDAALARALALLDAHPELPQAAWLRAEVERSRASRWLRLAPRDEAQARAAWAAAAALDGGRVAGIGEVAAATPAKHPVTITTLGVRTPSRFVLRVDGKALPAREIPDGLAFDTELAPAQHQIVAIADGRVIDARWTSSFDAPMGLEDTGSCTAADLAVVRREGSSVRAPAVSCASWLAVAAGPTPGSVVVARCAGHDCGPLSEWHVHHVAVQPPPPSAERKHWPAWATWTLVGVGAAGATVIGIVASGALQSRATESRFTVGGLRQE